MAVEPVAEPESEQTAAEVPEPVPPLPTNGIIHEDTKMEEVKSQPPDDTPLPLDGVPSYRTKYIMSGHARSISAIKFNPDGTMLASCGEQSHVRVSRVADV